MDEQTEAGLTHSNMSTLFTEVDQHTAGYIDHLARRINDAMIAAGFWHQGSATNVSEKLMLAVTELAEGCEAARKGNPNSDHIPDMDNLTEEIADTIIRLLDLHAGLANHNHVMGTTRYSIGEAIIMKMKYNATRPFMHGKEF